MCWKAADRDDVELGGLEGAVAELDRALAEFPRRPEQEQIEFYCVKGGGAWALTPAPGSLGGYMLPRRQTWARYCATKAS
jgi:hypothetical protein